MIFVTASFRRKYYFSYGNFFLSDIKIMPVEEKLKFKIKIFQGNTVIRNLSVKGNTHKSLDKYTKISTYEQINPNTLKHDILFIYLLVCYLMPKFMPKY